MDVCGFRSTFRAIAIALALGVGLCDSIPSNAQDQPAPTTPPETTSVKARNAAKRTRPAAPGEKHAGKTRPSARLADDLPPRVMSKAAADAKHRARRF